jgi:hypothetical protein
MDGNSCSAVAFGRAVKSTTEGIFVTNRPLLRRSALSAVAVLSTGLALATTPASSEARDLPASSSAVAGTRLGAATYLQGTVVNATTGNSVAGIRVTLRDVVSLDVLASDMSNASGVFRMNDLSEDEYAVKFAGARQGYETGFLGCGHGVVPTWGEACSFGTGRIGKARLEKLP